MKQLLICLLLTMNGFGQENTLDSSMVELPDFVMSCEAFEQGEASTGEQYFTGLLAEVIRIDVYYQKMIAADNRDASAQTITSIIDSALISIESTRKALDVYLDKDWPKRKTFHYLTIQWIEAMEAMLINYAKPLTIPMSRPDETWTDQEIEIYDEWLSTYELYLELDSHWVAFQNEYAEANGFTLGTETIDIDELMNGPDSSK